MKPLKKFEKEITQLLSRSKPRDDNSEVADLIVQARLEHFITPAGIPDYKGKSYAYRLWFGEILNSLKLSNEDRDKLASRIRYSTGNSLRKILNEEQLEEAQLKPTSPRQRSSRTYQRISGPYNRLKNSVNTIEEVDELVQLFTDALDSIHGPELKKRFLDGINKQV